MFRSDRNLPATAGGHRVRNNDQVTRARQRRRLVGRAGDLVRRLDALQLERTSRRGHGRMERRAACARPWSEAPPRRPPLAADPAGPGRGQGSSRRRRRGSATTNFGIAVAAPVYLDDCAPQPEDVHGSSWRGRLPPFGTKEARFMEIRTGRTIFLAFDTARPANAHTATCRRRAPFGLRLSERRSPKDAAPTD
jgi:hypothetical protein